MKRKMSGAIVIGVAVVLGVFTGAYAWTDETWGSISRATIESRAMSMISLKWTPKNTIQNWEVDNTYYPFKKGTTYTGVAYSQDNPQENRSEFENFVKNTAGGKTRYGNDCSGFVSISWRLPRRYRTTDFESDATSPGGYVTSLGDINTGQKAGLLVGDALVKAGSKGHMVLFKEKTSAGIKTMEQTTWSHVATSKREWTWTQLKQYRPIRRNSLQ